VGGIVIDTKLVKSAFIYCIWSHRWLLSHYFI